MVVWIPLDENRSGRQSKPAQILTWQLWLSTYISPIIAKDRLKKLEQYRYRESSHGGGTV